MPSGPTELSRRLRERREEDGRKRNFPIWHNEFRSSWSCSKSRDSTTQRGERREEEREKTPSSVGVLKPRRRAQTLPSLARAEMEPKP